MYPEYVENYFANWLYLTNFVYQNYNNTLPQYKEITSNIFWSTFKCMGVASSFVILAKFSKGRQHYLEYVKSLFLGSTLGLGYSIYFTNAKLMSFLAKERAIEEYIDEKKKAIEGAAK